MQDSKFKIGQKKRAMSNCSLFFVVSLESVVSVVSLRIIPNLPKFFKLPNLSFLTFHLSVFTFALSSLPTLDCLSF